MEAGIFSASTISIHALREEGDLDAAQTLAKRDANFYPRPPRGGRPGKRPEPDASPIFLSTPSARRATSRFRIFLHSGEHFYPRPPRGGRQWGFYALLYVGLFLSTPSARRATLIF